MLITQTKTNWKFLAIVIILAAVAGGGIFWWQQQIPFYQLLETKIPERIKNETADWQTKQYGFEINHPAGLETRWHISNKETANGCVTGEQVSFYFYEKGQAPPNLIDYGTGSNLFEGYLTSDDYPGSETSTECESFGGPPGDIKFDEFILTPPFQLSSTTLIARKGVQFIGCEIKQIAEFSVGQYYNNKYDKLQLNFYLDSFELPENVWQGDWQTACAQKFLENNLILKEKIKQFDSIVKSLKFSGQ
jgi:hypothetical protein